MYKNRQSCIIYYNILQAGVIQRSMPLSSSSPFADLVGSWVNWFTAKQIRQIRQVLPLWIGIWTSDDRAHPKVDAQKGWAADRKRHHQPLQRKRDKRSQNITQHISDTVTQWEDNEDMRSSWCSSCHNFWDLLNQDRCQMRTEAQWRNAAKYTYLSTDQKSRWVQMVQGL